MHHTSVPWGPPSGSCAVLPMLYFPPNVSWFPLHLWWLPWLPCASAGPPSCCHQRKVGTWPLGVRWRWQLLPPPSPLCHQAPSTPCSWCWSTDSCQLATQLSQLLFFKSWIFFHLPQIENGLDLWSIHHSSSRPPVTCGLHSSIRLSHIPFHYTIFADAEDRFQSALFIISEFNAICNQE